MQLYNSLSNALQDFEPIEPGKVRMYVCGMTVYDLCHIGHARAMISFDVLYRYLQYKGFEVTYVRNYTDVDDKIIQRAAELGEEALALSARYCQALDEDLGALGLALPTHQPKVSEHIDGIIAMTQTLVDKGFAYAAEDGTVYFEVERFEEYGKLSGRKVEDLRAGERVALDERKKSPFDFALWKAAKPGEIAWESPWGMGRPGWHIECSVMSAAHLGESFDIHGGGIDLIFPHHENEIAQSECAHGTAPMARYWLHNGHLTLYETNEEGERVPVKMSKSLGNVINIRDAVKDYPVEGLKLLYVASHYRSPLPFSVDGLVEMLGSLNRIYEAKENALAIAAKPEKGDAAQVAKDIGGIAQELYDVASTFKAEFEAAMDADLNTAKAVSLLFDLTRRINGAANDKGVRKRGSALMKLALEAFEITGVVLGVGGQSPEDFYEEYRTKRARALGIDPEWVEELLAQRQAARKAKDWGEADRIRGELDARSIIVMDGADGVSWRIGA